MTQQFHKGDLVLIAKDLGHSMAHFTADCEAIVVGSYADQFGGRNDESYTLFLKGSGEHSWYYGQQLTLIERGRLDLLQQWNAEHDATVKRLSDLEWIFCHGPEVLNAPAGASAQALANCMNFGSLWGDRGEGIDFVTNSWRVIHHATPFLLSNDKAGWIEHAKSLRVERDTTDFYSRDTK